MPQRESLVERQGLQRRMLGLGVAFIRHGVVVDDKQEIPFARAPASREFDEGQSSARTPLRTRRDQHKSAQSRVQNRVKKRGSPSSRSEGSDMNTRATTLPRRFAARIAKLLPPLIVPTTWACLVVVCFVRLRAGTVGLPNLNSDTAIPILMTNDRHWDVFQLFYYGQDRFGAWPFLSIRLGAAVFGATIRWEHLQICLMAWVFSGAVVMAALCRPAPAVGALVYMVVLLINPEMGIMFDVSQPYGWQLTTILLAWWSFRCLLESIITPQGPAGAAMSFRLLGTMGCTAMATWMSPMSGPVLLWVQSLELVRVRRCFLNHLRYLGLVAVPILTGVGFELLLRKLYHDFASTHFGDSFRTLLRVDWGHLVNNTRGVWQTTLESNWSIIAIASALIAIVAAGLLRRILGPRFGRDRPKIASDVLFLTLGCALVALLQMPIIAAGQHFRLNQFDGRFFALGRFFGSAAGLLSIIAAASIILGRFNSWSVFSRVGSGVGLAVLAATLPMRSVDPGYIAQKRVAAELATRRPYGVLLSGYWDTYELAALEPTLVPLPFEGETLRIPWHVAALRDAEDVVVGHQGFDDAHRAPKVGTPVLNEYGVTLRLLIPDWYVDGIRHYSLYRNETPSLQHSGRAP